MFKKKLYNMQSKRLPKIASNFKQNPHLCLKHGRHKDAQSWLNHWGVNEEIILGRNDSVKDTITSKFRDKLWDNKELEGKRKLRYYKEVIKSTLENHNYVYVFTRSKKKMNIAKIITNSHFSSN